MKKVWFVTGASKGLGLAIVKKLLFKGYRVAATSRDLDALRSAVGTADDNFLPLEVDINNEESIENAVNKTLRHFGKIDVLVNNAGYGQVGALEELSDAESRKNFDVNVFGLLNVTRQILPYMREQKSGHIYNISSIGGFTGAFPGFGIYCATKFAVQGLSESLAAEVNPFGVKVTVVSPGYFRTNFLDATSLSVSKNPIEAYKNVREIQAAHENDYNGNQPGDPFKAAMVMINLAEEEEAPLHLFLGQDAYHLAESKIEALKSDMNAMKVVATATAFSEN